MASDGFARYRSFFQRPPALVVHWHDDRTPAQAWLCIDSLHGGAAGGGTRLRDAGSREEAVFLAKTMAVKFRVCGPDIGGGKSVLRFDPHSPDKRGVLERWYKHITPYLRECYGTGGDVNVDEVTEATAITAEVAGIGHPQEGICRGHIWSDGENPASKVRRLKRGCEATVRLRDLPGPRGGAWMVADVVTGLGVARSIEAYARLRDQSLAGKRVSIEGFGAVGAFAAYYLERLGVRLVAASTKGKDGFRVAINETGFDAKALITSREGTSLPAPARDNHVLASRHGDEIFDVPADIFVPAGASHTLTAPRLRKLKNAGVKVWSCGANNPFAYKTTKPDVNAWVGEMIELQRAADKTFTIIPDFVANCGMARTFAYLMSANARPRAADIIADTNEAIDLAVEKLLKGHRKPTGLLEHGYDVFVP